MATDELVDPEVRQRVTSLLHELLPELYRVWDQPPHEDLRDFLSILAAPLAQVRQSVESLHADLFIDSCDDDMLPALAEMVGTVLVFPDAASNRRDLRSTAAWRRRKGSVRTLESLTGELLDQLVTTQEGWKRLLITQDLRQARPERVIADVRDPLLAEQSSGPGETLLRVVDVRSISARTGRYHPLHVTHWTHPTHLFPLRRGDARSLEEQSPGLHAFHPLGRLQALRVDRREGDVRSDRVPPGGFAKRPERFFGAEGGFNVRICGLLAGMTGGEAPLRNGSARSADSTLTGGGCYLNVLELGEPRSPGPMALDAFTAIMPRQPARAVRPDWSTAELSGGVLLSSQPPRRLEGVAPRPRLQDAYLYVPMLRLSYRGPEREVWFPGAVVELGGLYPRAARASQDPELAMEGFLRGRLVVRIPGLWLNGERWLYVATDGSIFDAGTPEAPAEVTQDGDALVFSGEPLAVGPGAAWPPSEPGAVDTPLTLLPPSATHGPVLMHWGQPYKERLDYDVLPTMALAFAAVDESGGQPVYIPLLRLKWRDGDLSNARWEAVRDDGKVTRAVDRFQQVAALAREKGGRLSLAVRLEGDLSPDDTDPLIMPPCEVAWTPGEGEPLLLYLPELTTTRFLSPQAEAWPSTLKAASEVVSLHADGSSRWLLSKQVARYALGSIAPLDGTWTLRRRQVRGRDLTEAVALEDPREGCLDVDPAHGLFALSRFEPPQTYPPRSGLSDLLPSFVGAVLTVDYQEGYSGHVGARPAPREPLLRERLPAPTRRVVRNGRLRVGSEDVPLYASVAEALRAIEASPRADGIEVVQLEDSATYPEDLVWPSDAGLRAEGKRLELTVQAAEAERPVVEFSDWTLPDDGTRYARLTLRGLYLAGGAMAVPADRATLQLCTVARADQVMTFLEGTVSTEVELFRCVTAGLSLRGQGTLRVEDCVVDAAGQQALSVPEGLCALSRVTVLGATEARVLEASEVLFDGPASVADRFHGYVRYSRVPEGTLEHLPRPHRVVEDAGVRFVSRDRDDPAHARLAADAEASVVRGAQDGSELGAFHHVRLAQRYEALEQRLAEYTPAGLSSGVLRLD